MSEFHCPNCGAVLAAPNMPCPFCAEAQRLLQQLMEKDEVRLCTRCGALLEDAQADLCPDCRKVGAVSPSFWQRDDRIAGWIRDRFVEPVTEREGLVCPSCQAPVTPLAVFCAHCGYRLAGAPEATVPPQPAAVAPEEPEPAADTAPPDAGPPVAGPPDRDAAAAGPSWGQQALEFWHDLFRPRGPVLEQDTDPWYKRSWRWLRLAFGSKSSEEGGAIWLWILLGIMMVGVAAMVVFWATLLRSGNLVFR